MSPLPSLTERPQNRQQATPTLATVTLPDAVSNTDVEFYCNNVNGLRVKQSATTKSASTQHFLPRLVTSTVRSSGPS